MLWLERKYLSLVLSYLDNAKWKNENTLKPPMSSIVEIPKRIPIKQEDFILLWNRVLSTNVTIVVNQPHP